MVTGQQIVRWGYLLDPCIELTNTDGKPLTNGWICVYIHGTREKYYCASDFNGTLHPFNIPLDSLGSNVILANPDLSYDVYVYNRFGNLVMSRYNVSPGHASGTVVGGSSAGHWIGTNGSSVSAESDQYTQSIPLPVSPDYEGDFIDRIVSNNIFLKDGLYFIDAILKFRQDPEDLTNTIGDIHVFTGHTDTESTVYTFNGTGPESDDSNVHQVRVQFIRHVTGSSSNIVSLQVKSPNDLQYVLLQRLSIVKFGGGSGSVGPSSEYYPGQYISIQNNVISATGLQPSGDYLVQSDIEGLASESYVDQKVESEVSGKQDELEFTYDSEDKITSIDGHGIAGTGGGSEYTPGQYISIQNNVISATGLQPSGNYADADDVSSEFDEVDQKLSSISGKVDEVSGSIPSLDGYATEAYVQSEVSGKADKSEIPSLDGYATESYVQSEVSGKADKSEIPSLDGYATESYVQEQVSGLASESYVDRAVESATSGKQDELTFTYDSEDKITSIDGHGIAGTGGGSEYTPGQYISIENNVISATGLQPSGDYVHPSDVSGLQINADWTATSGKSEILNKPQESNLYAGSGIVMTQSGNDWIISTSGGGSSYTPGQYIEITDDDVINVTGLPTQEDIDSATSGKLDSSAYVEPVQSDWNQSDSTSLDYIKNKPSIPSLDGYATETYVQEQVSGLASETYVQEHVSGLASETYVDEHIESATSGKADKSEIPSLDGYATESWVDQQGYLKTVPSEYVTDSELTSAISGKADKTEIPSVAGLASETYVDQHIEQATSGKADKSEIPSLEGYATESYVDSQVSGKADISDIYDLSAGQNISLVQSGEGYVINVTGLDEYVKQDDLSSYATESYVDSQVSGKQDELDFTYDSEDKITSIDGHEIAGTGGSVIPSAVSGRWEDTSDTVESNSAAWGGSALPVSAGPGIKMELVDDTLVFSNDETVLWNGNGTGSSSVTLSESMTNFKMLRIMVGNESGSDGLEYKYFNSDPDKIKHIMYLAGGAGNGYYVCNLMSCTNTTLTVSDNVNVIRSYGNDTVTGSRNVQIYLKCIHEVVGIIRIAGGN